MGITLAFFMGIQIGKQGWFFLCMGTSLKRWVFPMHGNVPQALTDSETGRNNIGFLKAGQSCDPGPLP